MISNSPALAPGDLLGLQPLRLLPQVAPPPRISVRRAGSFWAADDDALAGTPADQGVDSCDKGEFPSPYGATLAGTPWSTAHTTAVALVGR